MCIISSCPKGTPKNTKEVTDFITSGFNCNRAGSGFMYKKAGENFVHINKGFFNLANLLKAIKDADLKDEDELVIHHRIATAGNTDDENTHPFVVSDIHEEVILLEGKVEKPCLAHNGIFSNIKELEWIDQDYSDTYAFSRYIMSEPNILNLFKTNQAIFKIALKGVLSWSRLALLFPDRDMIMLGDFTKDNGYFHSNDGYKRHVVNRGGIEETCSKQKSWTKSGPGHTTNSSIKTIGPSCVRSTLYSPIKIGDLTIQPQLRLDGSIIRITNSNWNNFFFVKKDDKDSSRPFYFKDYSDKPLDRDSNCLARVNMDRLQYVIPYTCLHTDYWFYPKPMWQNIYRDYIHIIEEIDAECGKKTFKKLYSYLRKLKPKSNTDKIFWKRMGEHLYISALYEWYDYWKADYKQPDLPIHNFRDVEVINKTFEKYIKNDIDAEEHHAEIVD